MFVCAAEAGQVELKKKQIARPKLSNLQTAFAALSSQDK